MEKRKEVIQNTINYIEAHLDKAMRLDDIAKEAGYSKFHLNRMFSEMTGMTIHKYIQRRRLTEAARNLISTEKTIIEITYEGGYDSQQAFTLAFRELYGYTPQAYREQGVFCPQQNKIIMRQQNNQNQKKTIQVWDRNRGGMAA